MTDSALDEVYAALLAADPHGVRVASVLRATLDQLYDGQHTGRYRWEQLYKTEKTHCGTLVEINLQRDFKFADGVNLDYSIGGHEVDCKYSQKHGGWMIPNEAFGELCLVVTADDTKSTWSAGLVRATRENVGVGRNRDAKASLSAVGRRAITWLQHEASLPPNVLLSLAEDDLASIFGRKKGQARVDELFRRVQGRRIGRGVVATVAQQQDYMKRVRDNGGSRSRLRPEGVVILGDSQPHRRYAEIIGVPAPAKGECVSARVVPAERHWREGVLDIEGQRWRLATKEDPVVPGPIMANPRVAVSGDL